MRRSHEEFLKSPSNSTGTCCLGTCMPCLFHISDDRYPGNLDDYEAGGLPLRGSTQILPLVSEADSRPPVSEKSGDVPKVGVIYLLLRFAKPNKPLASLISGRHDPVQAADRTGVETVSGSPSHPGKHLGQICEHFFP